MNKYELRKHIFIAIIVIAFTTVLVKLFYLQIVDISYKISAENNSQRIVTQYPARGLIFDRNGDLLVCNEAAYDLMVIPGRTKEFDTIGFIENLNIEIEAFYRNMDRAKSFSYFRPSLFYKQMTAQQYAQFQEHLHKYPGFFVQERTLRQYTRGIAAHVLGDVGEVDSKTLSRDSYYRMGDYIGKSGVEQSYEEHLRGTKGSQIFLVDVHNNIQGSYMGGMYDTTAIPGSNLTLTIDASLQEYSEKLMQNKMGAIVAIEPATGEVLVMASAPTFDPQLLVGRPRGYNYDSLLNEPNRPLFNRAVSATYPPGSVFKVANALVALQEGVIKDKTYIPCNQSWVRCHGHPKANSVAKSIAYSCNPYYYESVRRIVHKGVEPSIFRDAPLGLKRWKELILTLGFEKSFDIGLSGVNKGLIPGTDYYNSLYGKYRWAYSTIYSLSIGQGEVLTSTLQLANMSAAIANTGYYIQPHLVKEIDGVSISGAKTHKVFTPFDKKHFETVADGMYMAVNEPYGTAYWTRLPDIKICGKTGTVQNPHGENHSVYIAFAPRENPQIAIAVFLENAGYGGSWAAPTASLLIEKYLTGETSKDWREQRILEANFIDMDVE